MTSVKEMHKHPALEKILRGIPESNLDSAWLTRNTDRIDHTTKGTPIDSCYPELRKASLSAGQHHHSDQTTRT